MQTFAILMSLLRFLFYVILMSFKMYCCIIVYNLLTFVFFLDLNAINGLTSTYNDYVHIINTDVAVCRSTHWIRS